MTTSAEAASTLVTDQQARRRELASYLRSRRERIAPEQIGLPGTGRRRTPGLRREEVALIAGMGVTWYTWLEQGRDINVSEPVLRAIARTLRLDSYETSHLYRLAGQPEPVTDRGRAAIPPALLVVMRQLEPIPAAVINARFDLLAWNDTYAEMVGGVDDLPAEDRNWLVLMLTSSRWRAGILDWEDAAARLVGRFRADMAAHTNEVGWTSLVARLRRESPYFEQWWNRHDVRGPESFPKRYLHADVGLMAFDYLPLSFGESAAFKLVTYTPADDATWAKVRALQAEFALRPPAGVRPA